MRPRRRPTQGRGTPSAARSGTGRGLAREEPEDVVEREARPAAVEAVDRAMTPSRRHRRRALLLAASPGLVFLVVVAAVGSIVAPVAVSVPVAVVLGCVVWLAVWRGATPWLLRSLGAVAADEELHARPFNLVDGLCASMGLSPPALSIVDDPRPDALALGRAPDAAVVVMTRGLVEQLDPVELEAVLAHELTHIKDGDIALGTVAAALLLPWAGVVPGVGDTVHGLVGRGREFGTDQRAIAVTRYPPGLSGALASMAEGAHAVQGDEDRGPSRVERVTRWLWTVPLGGLPRGPGVVGELDAPSVRIAALDEW